MFYPLALPIFKGLDVAFANSDNFHHTQLFRLYADKYFFRHYGRFSSREEREEALFRIWFHDFILRICLQQKEHFIAELNLLLGEKKTQSNQQDIDIMNENLRRLSILFSEYTNHHSSAVAIDAT